MTARVAADLRGPFMEIFGRYGVALDEFETDSDHAHLLVTYPPKVALSTLVKCR
jgi:putative transposase